jgi:LCP family protein required for cell wall assembly
MPDSRRRALSLNREFQPVQLGLSGRSERSGVAAAALSFIFPGLGQAYLRDRRAAIIFAAPIVVLLAVLLAFVSLDGVNRVGAKLLNPSIALGAALLALLVGVWWIINVINAWRGGRHTGTNTFIAPAILIVALAAGTLYGADWMYRLSLADRNFGTGCDPTLDCPPGPTPSGIAVVPTTPPPSGPTFPPEDTPEPSEPPATIAPGPSPSFDITKLSLEDGWLNVLLVGIDSRCAGVGVVTGANTDTMIVASANADTGEVFMFSFPRDSAGFPLYVGGSMPGYWKLNTFTGYTKQHPEVFPEPGLPALAYELGYLLGIPIDYYASINICGFPHLIDEVGGVDICNSKLIQDSGYHWTDGHVGFTLETGPHHLDGETALAYARSRHGSSDFARARRQQELLGALRKAVLTPQNLARLPEIVSTAGELVHTNFPSENIEQLLALADKLQDDKPGQYVFQPPLWASHPPRIETNGRSVQFLKLDAIAALSRQVFGDKSLYEAGGEVPSFAPTTLPSATPGPSPTVENPC